MSASPAKEAGIEVGDVLLAIEGTKLADANQVAEVINQHKDKSILTFQVKRGERIFTAAVKPLLCQETNRPRVGLYVRDSAAGVGTLTFYDPQTQIYGALGHVITDVDTNQAIEIKDGEIVKASIVNIRAAQRLSRRENGCFQEGEDLAGTIEKNCQFGIFGRLSSIMPVQGSSSKALPIALASQVKPDRHKY